MGLRVYDSKETSVRETRMAKTGPQKYPGASLTYWYQDNYGGSAMESNVGVIHTTEGMSVPTYGGGASAPNLTALPDIRNKRLRWYQHFDFDVSSRALMNRSGGVQTNTANAVQVELVGTCDPKHRTSWGDKKAGIHYLYWPDAPDWALAELAKFVKWAHEQHGVRLSSTVTWKAYPSSYGSNGVRLTGSQWNAYYGWLGHQHVPENDHGDPGDLDFARVLEHAKGDTRNDSPPQQEEESDVPSTLGLYSTTDRPLVPGKWTTISIEKTDLLTGAEAYTASVMLTITGAPAGGTLQGRFYHQRPDGSRWDSGIVERPTTAGTTFADLPHLGSIAPAEKLRFEVAYFPADPADEKSVTITTSRVRGLYWK